MTCCHRIMIKYRFDVFFTPLSSGCQDKAWIGTIWCLQRKWSSKVISTFARTVDGQNSGFVRDPRWKRGTLCTHKDPHVAQIWSIWYGGGKIVKFTIVGVVCFLCFVGDWRKPRWRQTASRQTSLSTCIVLNKSSCNFWILRILRWSQNVV